MGAAQVAEAKSGGLASSGIELRSILAHSLGMEVFLTPILCAIRE